MNDARLVALAELELALESLLAALEAPAGDPVDLSDAWRRCSSAFAHLCEAAATASAAGADLPPELRSRAAKVRRLHAVAASLAQRQREACAPELERVSRARRLLRRPRGSRGGASCDVTG